MSAQELKLKAIADAIRAKDGTAAPIPAADFPARIRALNAGGAPEGTYTITLSASDEAGGTVSGGGTASAGMTLTVQAQAAEGYVFSGWRENGQTVSDSTAYTFTAASDRLLTAEFAIDAAVCFGWKASQSTSGRDICYGNNTFVMTNGQSGASYSTDGITWTRVTYSSTGVSGSPDYTTCEYGANKFVALNKSYLQYSATGTSWTTVNGMPNVLKYGLSCGDNKFICFPSSASTYIYRSSDGLKWSIDQIMPAAASYCASAYGDGKFVVVAHNTDTAACYVWDGTPIQTKLPVSAYWRSAAYGGGKFVAIAYTSDDAACSADGIAWEAAKLPASLKWSAVTYGDGKFVAVAEGSNQTAYSRDGLHWSFADDVLPSANSWCGIIYAASRFVVISSNSPSAYSTA